MKPRERKQQKQSSRLYLRRKDHREIIMNNKYHNAMWLKKTKSDGTVQDELVWAKYPDRAFSFSTPISSGGVYLVDIDRQFIHKQRGTGSQNSSSSLRRTRNFAVNIYNDSSSSATKISISKDGVVHKISQESYSNGFQYNIPEQVGETDCLMAIIESTDYKSIVPRKLEILNYDETDYSYTTRMTDLPRIYFDTTSTNSMSGYILSKSQDGVVFAKVVHQGASGESNYRVWWRLYNIDVTGACTVLADLFDYPITLGNTNYDAYITNDYGQNVIVECNGNYYLALCYRVKKSVNGQTLYEQHARILHSTDRMNWGAIELGETVYESTYAHTPDVIIVARGGKVYCYALYETTGAKQFAKLFVSEDMQTFTQAIMPSIVDIPITKSGGSIVSSNTQYEYVRVVTNETLETGTLPSNTIRLFPFNAVHFNAKCFESCYQFFKQGEFLKNGDEDADYGVIFANYNVAVYTPTMDFREHEDMFAFVIGSGEQADKVIEGDYVL